MMIVLAHGSKREVLEKAGSLWRDRLEKWCNDMGFIRRLPHGLAITKCGGGEEGRRSRI